MTFSERSGLDRAPNRLSFELDALRRRGAPLLDLTQSNPTAAGIPYDVEALRRAIGEPRWLRYEPDPRGARVAREAVCASWAELGQAVTPEQVLLTASTSEAYAHLFKLLCDPGDEILIPAPSYPLFEHLARFEGVQVVPYPLAFDGSWYIDVPALAARVGPRARGIVLVSPNNPTGNFVKTEELRALAQLGLPVISDEVFGPYGIDVPRHAARSALEGEGLLVFALSGLSKLAALPQLKLAWITVQGPSALATEAIERLELILDGYLSPSAPVVLALPELLAASAASRASIRARIADNARTLARACAGTPLTLLPIEGGWYAVLRFPSTRPEETWVLSLLTETGVLIQPGYFFDFPSEPYGVVSLLTPEATLAEGVARIREHVLRG